MNRSSIVASSAGPPLFAHCGNGHNAPPKSPLIKPGALSHRLPSRLFRARKKIFFLSVTLPASWSRLLAKESITHFAQESSPQVRLRKSSAAKIDNSHFANSLVPPPKCIGEDSGSIDWRAPRLYLLASVRSLSVQRELIPQS